MLGPTLIMLTQVPKNAEARLLFYLTKLYDLIDLKFKTTKMYSQLQLRGCKNPPTHQRAFWECLYIYLFVLFFGLYKLVLQKSVEATTTKQINTQYLLKII